MKPAMCMMLAVAAIGISGAVGGQAFPSRPVTLTVGFAPGGGTDTAARIIAQKLGEEAVEAVIEGVKGDRTALVGESADLFYHLLVLWAAVGVSPADVAGELARREGTSGIAEKRGRKDP